MRKVRGKNTTPEIRFRKLLWGMGYRGYRIHAKNLPGKPDVVFTKKKKAIFIHGCFWHGHDCRAGRNVPKSNVEYWGPKLKKNMQRDKQHISALKRLGWSVMVVWECRLKDEGKIKQRIKSFCN
jgi:DNA mismatch endonuclease (patch repair protein)